VDFEPFGGKMPKNWKKGMIRDLCIDTYNGGTPRRNESRFWDGNIPWLTSGEVRQAIIIKPENCISEYGLLSSSAKWVPPFSTVVALYGATAGQVSMVTSRLTTNQAVCSLVPQKNCVFYNYLLLQNTVSDFENKAVGSAQQNISKTIVEQTFCIIPNSKTLAEFNELVSPFFQSWITNLEESARLAVLRDALLPRLMSGEIDV
jgi:type I restriction enzyme S subunit